MRSDGSSILEHLGDGQAVFDLSKPCILIALDVESTKPRVCPLVGSKLAAGALLHWLRSQPELMELLAHALQIAYGDNNTKEWISEFDGDPG